MNYCTAVYLLPSLLLMGWYPIQYSMAVTVSLMENTCDFLLNYFPKPFQHLAEITNVFMVSFLFCTFPPAFGPALYTIFWYGWWCYENSNFPNSIILRSIPSNNPNLLVLVELLFKRSDIKGDTRTELSESKKKYVSGCHDGLTVEDMYHKMKYSHLISDSIILKKCAAC